MLVVFRVDVDAAGPVEGSDLRFGKQRWIDPKLLECARGVGKIARFCGDDGRQQA